MNNLKKPLVIVGAIVLLILAGLSWDYMEEIKEKTKTENEYFTSMKNKCFLWAEYDPDKKAWRWMSANAIELGKGGFFPSREDTVENCLATYNYLETK